MSKKSNAPLAVAVGVAALGVGALALGFKSENPSKVEEQAPQRKPIAPVDLEFITSSEGVEGLKIHVNAYGNALFSQYRNVHYVIPGESIVFPLPRGIKSANTDLKRPHNFDDDVFMIYGFNPRTREKELLYKRHLGER